MPLDAAGYVHRIGRTGRANKTGASISLVSLMLHCLFIHINLSSEITDMLQSSYLFWCLCPYVLAIASLGFTRGG